MCLRLFILLLLATGKVWAQQPPAIFHPEKLAEMDAAVRAAIGAGKLPGGVLWLERKGEVHRQAFGNRRVEPVHEAAPENTIYDAASLTKVLATAPSVMKLVELGKVDLAAPVSRYLPEFAQEAKARVTVRQLLTHTAGTRPGIADGWDGYAEGIQRACAEPLAAEPGTVFRYSDINYILLGEIVRRVSGKPLDEFAEAEIFRPLGMRDTMFSPPIGLRGRVAPTTRETVAGLVHDPTAQRLGGVAGHAGLFTTAADVAIFCRMMLGGGELGGVRVLKAETVKLMTSVQTPAGVAARRGLGWDIDSGYSTPRGRWLPLGSYGHTGWTGGSIWIDPFSQTFVIFLSNRNHPTESGSVASLRQTLGTLAAEAVVGFNFLYVPGALPPTESTIDWRWTWGFETRK